MVQWVENTAISTLFSKRWRLQVFWRSLPFRGPFCPKRFKKVPWELFPLITSPDYMGVCWKRQKTVLCWESFRNRWQEQPSLRRGHVEWKYELLTLDPFASLFWFLEQYTVGRHKQRQVFLSFVRLGKNSGQLAATPTHELAWFLIRKNYNAHHIFFFKSWLLNWVIIHFLNFHCQKNVSYKRPFGNRIFWGRSICIVRTVSAVAPNN